MLVLEGDRPVSRRVRTGLSDGQYVEVLEGLSAGEKVVIGSAAAGRQSSSPGATGGSRTTQQRQAPLPGVPGAPGGGMLR